MYRLTRGQRGRWTFNIVFLTFTDLNLFARLCAWSRGTYKMCMAAKVKDIQFVCNSCRRYFSTASHVLGITFLQLLLCAASQLGEITIF
jgi:hypothetical protein